MLKQKLAIAFMILGGSMVVAQSIVHQPVNSNGVTVIHTALDHISILAFPEKITRVAAGSDAVEIEWHDNNVFIKPVKGGHPTNLMVWTEHQFSAYELEAAGDVKSMTFALDQTGSLPQTPGSEPSALPKPSPEEIQRETDSVIGSTLLQATPVVSRGVRPAKDLVSVLIKEVVRDGSSFYVRFTVINNSPHPYRIIPPSVLTITPKQNAELLPSMKDLQISEQATHQFQSDETAQVTVRDADVPQKDVAPGRTVEGVLTIQPAEIEKPGVYQFVFGNDGNHPIKATAVL
jgi:hypothetical protein